MAEIKLRNVELADENFLFSTFLRGLYYGCEFYNKIDKEAFFDNYDVIFRKMLNRNDKYKVTIACLDDSPDIILGWTMTSMDGHVVHFVYVKDAWRNKGVAKQLLNGYSKINTVSHITKIGDIIRIKKGWMFNPFSL